MSFTLEQEVRLRKLCNAATPGPWQMNQLEHDIWIETPDCGDGEPCSICTMSNDQYDQSADAAFIAEARTALPAALDTIEELWKEIAELRETITRLKMLARTRCREDCRGA